ncbi:actin related protein 11 [Cavenderia fasciculata]|uniref:Actin related protein 11 n=1 Tax=Cavenderia fasciculata TaxID=261658 RepID=F4Q4Y7_CACFS|nr:actin related protein 11 [Cavenderia fasciculata]EGG17093.1 actin related protein 11 [Cavenderia fasciculata]|eukprot:XP_004355577.1 actin related protein 11 [Cavenderia fasciculata]
MDKSSIVLEIGGAYTKCGYTQEATPRFIINTDLSPLNISTFLSSGTEISFTNNNEEQQQDKDKDRFKQPLQKQLKESLYIFLNQIFFKYLLCDPGERKIILVENIFVPRLFRQALVSVLFEQFNVPCISFVNPLVCLLPLIRTTGFIIDCGLNETRVLPVYEGVGILKAMKTTNRGFNSLKQWMLKELQLKCQFKNTINNTIITQQDQLQTIHHSLLTDQLVEDIIVRCTVMAPLDYPIEKVSPITYQLKGNISIQLDAQQRLDIAKSIFNFTIEDEMNENDDIITIILNSLLDCDIDIRKSLCHNIVLIGGTTMIAGFKTRLIQELNKRCTTVEQEPRGQEELKGLLNHFEFIKHSFQPNSLMWLGASMIGSLDTIPTKLTLDQYIKNGRKVPEWERLNNNNSNNNNTLISSPSTIVTTSSSSPVPSTGK